MNPLPLIVSLTGVEAAKPIPEAFASCAADGAGGVRAGGNRSPAISWRGAPAETLSFAVVVVDPDVPADFSTANTPGRVIAAEAPRRRFHHWLVIDIPPAVTDIEEGGRAPGRIGRNSFGDRSKGINGYDGPCPPWNDERIHNYHFMVFALDVAAPDLGDVFSGEETEAAIAGHILARGEFMATYSTNARAQAEA